MNYQKYLFIRPDVDRLFDRSLKQSHNDPCANDQSLTVTPYILTGHDRSLPCFRVTVKSGSPVHIPKCNL